VDIPQNQARTVALCSRKGNRKNLREGTLTLVPLKSTSSRKCTSAPQGSKAKILQMVKVQVSRFDRDFSSRVSTIAARPRHLRWRKRVIQGFDTHRGPKSCAPLNVARMSPNDTGPVGRDPDQVQAAQVLDCELRRGCGNSHDSPRRQLHRLESAACNTRRSSGGKQI
jgi:hypothetical protein